MSGIGAAAHAVGEMTCTVPGADDAMLNDQSAFFRDMLHLRFQLRVRTAPAFEAWLGRMEMKARHGRIKQFSPPARPASRLLALTAS